RRARAHRLLGRLVPHLRRLGRAEARRDHRAHRREPARADRLSPQSRPGPRERARRALAEEGPGEPPPPAQRISMSWLLVRVDDRLIHGQVVVAWGERLRPKRIWVVDEAAAGDTWERELLASAAPGIAVRVTTIAEAAAGFAEEAVAEGGAILLLRDLATAVALLEAGAALRTVNLGGLHYAPGKTKVNE